MAKNEINPKLYSKSRTDRAGDLLRKSKLGESEKTLALMILSNWRAAHIYPMRIFTKRLKRVAQNLDKNAITAQRLKRVPSIIKKLNRIYSGDTATMKLTQIQDIAGCRVVLSNLNLVRELFTKDYGSSSDIKHKKVNEKDYITFPKEDGYRSIHLVYRYKSDKKNTSKYNGLLIEVQIRTELEHIWATAVETVDFFTRQAIKSNEGLSEWREFFRLVSSAFAMIEGTPLVINTPTDEKELYHAIKASEKQLNVIKRMKQWTDSVRLFDDIDISKKKKIDLFLLELDTIQEKLTITAYSKSQEKKAIQAYASAEQKIFDKQEYDVVLVGTDNFKELKSAYPNYFIDTRLFINELEKIINKY